MDMDVIARRSALVSALAHFNQGVRIGNLILAYPSVEGAYKRGYLKDIQVFEDFKHNPPATTFKGTRLPATRLVLWGKGEVVFGAEVSNTQVKDPRGTLRRLANRQGFKLKDYTVEWIDL